MTEQGFLLELSAHPNDHSAILRYACWLEQQTPPNAAQTEYLQLVAAIASVKGPKSRIHKRIQELTVTLDADWLINARKAEFLRLTLSVSPGTEGKGLRSRVRNRLQELAGLLAPNWLSQVSRLPIENCLQKRTDGEEVVPGQILEFVCDRRWEDLQPSGESVRFCEVCSQSVHYCDTIFAARRHAKEGHCIAVDLGIMRRKDDLMKPQYGLMLGQPSHAEHDTISQDPVSVRRESEKQIAFDAASEKNQR